MFDDRSLPRSLLPLPGESLPGLLLRLSHRLDQPPSVIAFRSGLARRNGMPTPVNHLLMLAPQFRHRFASATRVPEHLTDGLTLRPLVNRYPAVADALTRRGRQDHLRPRSYFPPWIFGTSTRYCPLCLAGDGSEIQLRHGGAWKTTWRLAVNFICLHHRIFLQDTCPSCQVPAHGASRKLSLLPSPTAAGLHPLQCRNTRTDLSHCGDRMDNPDHVVHTSTPSPEVIDLQQRLHHLLSPGCDPATAFAAFSDLQVLAAIVQATWPATASVTPEHRLADALDAHITAQQHRDLTTLTHVQRGNLWMTPPLSAQAMAGLMDIASRLLALPPAALPHAITALVGQLPPPTASGWGKTWTRLRHDASPVFRAQVMSALPRSFRVGGSREDASWRIARRPALRTRDRGYLPEHIPQWLPDDWFRLAVHDTSPKAMGLSVTYRRFVAVQLVQIATGFQMEEAARFLGIPDAWHQAAVQQRKLHSRSRYRYRTEDLSVSLESVGRHVAQLESPVNYRARRMRYSDWTLTPEEWASMTASLTRQKGRQVLPDLLIHACVSNSIWARLTGSEWRLAPSILIHFPSISSLDMGGKQAHEVRHRIRHRTSLYYRGLAELINQVAADEGQA